MIVVMLFVGLVLIVCWSTKDSKKDALYQKIEEGYKTSNAYSITMEECGKYKGKKIYRFTILYEDRANNDCIRIIYVSEDEEFMWRVV